MFRVRFLKYKNKDKTMQLKGYIIEKYNCMSNAYTCNRLTYEAEKEGIDLKIIGLYDTYITDNKIMNAGEVVEPRDFIINRYKWGKIKEEINAIADKTYNQIDKYDIYINKYEQVKRLRSTAFIVPKYCMSTSMIAYEAIVNETGTPFVAKGLESSMGEEIILISNKEDYLALQNTYSRDKEWLFEEFVKTSYGRDMRFYSIRGNAVACMQRKSQGDFRANVALGASVKPYEITPQIRQIAKDIYEQTQLDFLGIDLMFGEDKPYFCEINVMPGLEGIEKASGLNIAREIIRTIKGDFENE